MEMDVEYFQKIGEYRMRRARAASRIAQVLRDAGCRAGEGAHVLWTLAGKWDIVYLHFAPSKDDAIPF